MGGSALNDTKTHPSRLVGTFLFTDIEGSTRLWEADAERMQAALATHDAIVEAAVRAAGGEIFKALGDAFCCFFESPAPALAASVQIQRELRSVIWEPLPNLRVRMALYAGEAVVRGGDYFGPALNRASRIMGSGHGGQILVSATVQQLLLEGSPNLTLRDLGLHRLRDLQHPERIFQVIADGLDAEFPPLRSLTVRSDNLPKALSRFVGRETELAQVKHLLTGARLLSLLGSGGTGKTRLAIEVAGQKINDYEGGAWFIDLSQLRYGPLIGQIATQSLGLRWEPGRSPEETIANHIGDRPTLLVLDNCEHVLDAAAQFVQAMLSQTQCATILATSRQPLGLTGEWTFRVPSLGLPSREEKNLERFMECDAIRLFVERANQVRPDFRLSDSNIGAVERTCRELDGIPLAIELAAARIANMPVERVADRLDQRFRLLSQTTRGVLPRHQTLRAMIDWSYGLLNGLERQLLKRISVFAGGFTLEAAEAVCGGGTIKEYEILGLCAALAEKSLLMYEEATGRYRLLETVRAYVRELLGQENDAETWRTRHLRFMTELAEEAEPNLLSAAAESWMDTLDAERENWRAALEWSLQSGEISLGVRLGVALTRFFQARGFLIEGQLIFDHYLELGDRLSPPERAATLRSASALARTKGELESSIQLGRQALALFESLPDVEGSAAAMTTLGIASLNLGRIEEGRDYHARALELRRTQGNRPLIAMALNNVGAATFHLKDYVGAARYYEEALQINEGLGNRLSMAYNLANLAEVQLAVDEPGLALPRAVESCRILFDLGDRPALSGAMLNLAEAVCRTGNPAFAARIYGAQKALLEELRITIPPNEEEAYVRATLACRSILGDAQYEAEFAAGRILPMPEFQVQLENLAAIVNGLPPIATAM